MAHEQITYNNIDPRTRTAIMTGLLFAMLVACIDSTVVSTCAPVIAADLGGLSLYSWMITAYMLCETIMIPISGKLSDLFGRKPLFIVGLILFMIGSLIAGLSTNIEMFIACRAVQGLGGGILIPVATAAVADLYAPENRAKMQGIVGAVFGVGSGLGPVLGGFITEYFSWHWIFYINIPFAIIAFFLTVKKFPMPENDAKPTIDVKGIMFLSLFLLNLLMYFEWVGTKFSWMSFESMIMIDIAIILLALFINTEKSALEPIIAPHLLRNRTVIMSSIFMLLYGVIMMGVTTYSSMFAVNVLGLTTLKAGVYSLAMVAGMMITANLSGQLVHKTGYKLWLIGGPILAAIGLFMLSTMGLDANLGFYAASLLVFGLGLGCMMAVIMSAVQNSSRNSEVGMTTSAVNLVRSIGSTIGTAMFTLVINNMLTKEMSERLSPELFDYLPHDTGVLDYLSELSTTDAYSVLLSFANSLDCAFFFGGILALLLIIVGYFFKAQMADDKE